MDPVERFGRVGEYLFGFGGHVRRTESQFQYEDRGRPFDVVQKRKPDGRLIQIRPSRLPREMLKDCLGCVDTSDGSSLAHTDRFIGLVQDLTFRPAECWAVDDGSCAVRYHIQSCSQRLCLQMLVSIGGIKMYWESRSPTRQLFVIYFDPSLNLLAGFGSALLTV